MAAPQSDGAGYFEQLNQVLNAAPQMEEVDIIPCIEADHSSCPIIIDGNKIGILSWCVKELFCFAYTTLMAFKTNQKDLRTEGRYMMELSRVVLLLCAEDYTVWNLRKQYIVLEASCLEHELDFCTLVLKKHPRSSEAFAHRRWVIKHGLAENDEFQFTKSSKFLLQELQICLLCADRYRDNYTAWSQRCWLVNNFMGDTVDQLLAELQCTKVWIWTHISDHCGFHFRQHLLKKLRISCSEYKMKELVNKEFKLTDEILERYPGYQTVWYHRRFIISYWLSMSPPCGDCLLLWQNTNITNNLKESKKINDLCMKTSDPCACERHLSSGSRELKCEYCNSFKQRQPSDALSLLTEIDFCQKIMVNTNKSTSELVRRQSHLAASQFQWLSHFLQHCAQNIK